MVLLYLNPYLYISMPGGTEWLLILAVVLLLFGGKKIPELMRGLGKGIRDFNDAKSNVTKELEEGMKEKENVTTKTTSPTTSTTTNTHANHS